MKVYHGTDKATAKIIRQTSVLKGCPVFGIGVCLSKERALNFAAIKCQKYLTRGRNYARKQICVLEFEIMPEFFEKFSRDNCEDAFTLSEVKSLQIGHELKLISK